MKCFLKYPWVKLPRNQVPGSKGLMGSWMRLAARAAFRKGEGHYCGYENPVEPGMWVGGIVGLKAILGIRRRDAALDIIRCLEQLGFLSWMLDPSTKRLSYAVFVGAPHQNDDFHSMNLTFAQCRWRQATRIRRFPV